MTVKAPLLAPDERPLTGVDSPWARPDFPTYGNWGLGICSAEYQHPPNGETALTRCEGWLLFGEDRIPAGWIAADLVAGHTRLAWLRDEFTTTFLADSRSILAEEHMKPAVLMSRIIEKAIEGVDEINKLLFSLGPERLQELQQLARGVTQ